MKLIYVSLNLLGPIFPEKGWHWRGAFFDSDDREGNKAIPCLSCRRDISFKQGLTRPPLTCWDMHAYTITKWTWLMNQTEKHLVPSNHSCNLRDWIKKHGATFQCFNHMRGPWHPLTHLYPSRTFGWLLGPSAQTKTLPLFLVSTKQRSQTQPS